MKKKDHFALACHLASLAGEAIPDEYVMPFIFGSVEPDLNPFSYLRGMRDGKKFHGHNATNCAPHIHKRLFSIMTGGLEGAMDWFQLGVLLHYVADTFTSPHNDFMDISIKDHVAYEAKLHEVLERRLRDGKIPAPSSIPYSLFSHLHEKWLEYKALDEHSTSSDVDYITQSCTTILFWALQYVPAQRKVLAAISF